MTFRVILLAYMDKHGQKHNLTHASKLNKLCGRPPQYTPAPYKLTFDLLTFKVVSESRATWPTSVPILVFL